MPGRDNGFVARHYLPLADLDPRLAEAMLEVLRAESIAAYVEPSTGRIGGYLEVHLPGRPHDRLWVDREQRDRAATLLSEHTSASALPAAPAEDVGPLAPAADEPAAPTIEDAWAQLVANYDAPSAAAVPPWPVSEDVAEPTWSPYDLVDGQETLPLEGLSPSDSPSPVPRRIVRPADPGGVAPSIPVEPRGERSEELPTSSEYDPLSILDEHFVPPTPPPAPALRGTTKVAILAMVAGFALLIVKAFSDAVPGAIALGVLGIVGGFVALVAGMRADRDPDSDSDDGAVV